MWSENGMPSVLWLGQRSAVTFAGWLEKGSLRKSGAFCKVSPRLGPKSGMIEPLLLLLPVLRLLL
jgi:hypothetical protein